MRALRRRSTRGGSGERARGSAHFLAADEVDSWRIAIAADHHPRRGTRAPGRHDRVTLPYLVPSEYLAEAVRAAEERLVRADAGQRLPPPTYGDYEGVHPITDR